MAEKFSDLQNLIKEKKAKVAIIGLGYVGLPHAISMVKGGFSVSGIDTDQAKVASLNEGKSYIGDVTDATLREMIESKRFNAQTSFTVLQKADVVIICVPTPMDKYKIPDLSYVLKAAQSVKQYLHSGMLIVLESTTWPGTTNEVIKPILEETGLKVGQDIFLAFAPERIDPGNPMPHEDVPKVIGGITKKCTKIAQLFYSCFLKHVHPVSSTRAAEMTKILENTHRLVNISLINELSLLCGKMGLDIWEIIDAAKTKPYGFTPYYPSPKCGGHCIAIDPFYLSWKSREYNFWTHFIELAGEINEQRPHYVVTSVITALNRAGKSLKRSKILVIGAAYKKNINDSRESAIYEVIPDLVRKGARVDYYDPLIPAISWQEHHVYHNKSILKMQSIKYSKAALKKYDLVLILTDHSQINWKEVAKNSKLIVDTRNAIKSRKHKNVYWM